jgi:hypothetical protein
MLAEMYGMIPKREHRGARELAAGEQVVQAEQAAAVALLLDEIRESPSG